MENYYPTQLKKTENNSLSVKWNDESVTEITLTKLRDECPCVNCKGESVIFESYIPIKSHFKAAGYYEIEKIETIGNYAISIKWKDGHDTGIYSWDILRKL
ncbi:MAG: gamma-butyrobetaine hydroxylase-like domain-containing protein [Ignavibacteria bacterium]